MPSIQRDALCRSLTAPIATACSSACEYAKAPIGRAALPSRSAPRKAAGEPTLISVLVPVSIAVVVAVVAVTVVAMTVTTAVASGFGLER